MIIFTSAAKFTFPTIVSYSAFGIGLYLFYRKKVLAQFKRSEKRERSPYSFTRKLGSISLASSGHKEIASFLMYAVIMRKIMRSKDAQYNTNE